MHAQDSDAAGTTLEKMGRGRGRVNIAPPAEPVQGVSSIETDGKRIEKVLSKLTGSRISKKAMLTKSRLLTTTKDKTVTPIAHPGRLVRRELEARALSANRLAIEIGVPSGRITDILNGRRSITADTAIRLGRYFGNAPRFWLDLQSQYDIAVVEKERGAEIARRIKPADAA
jgi:addiction module HigA family antidote